MFLNHTGGLCSKSVFFANFSHKNITVKFIRKESRMHLHLVGFFKKKKVIKKRIKQKKLITEGFQKKNSNKEDNQVSFQTWARVPLVNFQQYKFDQAQC